MADTIPEEVLENEYLYRGVIELNWDFERQRVTSAAFKDSQGVSVDRQHTRSYRQCIDFLNRSTTFFAICKVQTKDVLELNALVKYLPIEGNPYHSEIHDSKERIQMRGAKPKRIREKSEIVYKR